ncbi:hypothetical protein ACFX19_032571 [Malus domestica]
MVRRSKRKNPITRDKCQGDTSAQGRWVSVAEQGNHKCSQLLQGSILRQHDLQPSAKTELKITFTQTLKTRYNPNSPLIVVYKHLFFLLVLLPYFHSEFENSMQGDRTKKTNTAYLQVVSSDSWSFFSVWLFRETVISDTHGWRGC